MPKRVRLLRDEIVAYGPQRLHGGEVYELPDGLAQHLVREGVAVRADAPTPEPDVASSEIRRWEELSVDELYEIAKASDIPGRSSMTKEELIAALEAAEDGTQASLEDEADAG